MVLNGIKEKERLTDKKMAKDNKNAGLAEEERE
jgi:hypothetical protein